MFTKEEIMKKRETLIQQCTGLVQSYNQTVGAIAMCDELLKNFEEKDGDRPGSTEP